MSDQIDQMAREITLLRNALEPFALKALTRWARNAPEGAEVTVPLEWCKAAQKAMAAP